MTINLGWLFTLASFLIFVLVLGVTWWAAALLLLLASVKFTITYN